MSAPKDSDDTRCSVRIRLLATTDLHGHLLPHDYIKDQPTQGGGLAGLGRLISEAREQAKEAQMPVVLLDNGDTFQGTPLATDLAEQEVRPDHPIVAAMNYLKYDAVGLGNHDLDHGLPYLKALALALNMPLLNSNLRKIDISPLNYSLLLPIDLGNRTMPPLTLGILSVLPVESAAWHRHHLGPETMLDAPEATIRMAASILRKQGADLIVVLGHMGVGNADSTHTDMLASHELVRTGEIDALILGHTHRRFPSIDYTTRKDVDIKSGTVGGVPTLMPGHAGSDLGVMDLTLDHDRTRGWTVRDHHCSLRPNGADTLPDAEIAAFAKQSHEHVRTKLTEKVATAPTPLHSYFSLVSPAPTQRLNALAQHRQVSEALRDSALAHLPILSSSAAHGAGGRDGPSNFVHIPEGPVMRRHIAGLNPFANQTVGIRITGSQIRNWLEHAALLFTRLSAQNTPQMLVDPNVPAFQFDTIFGLHYVIDPSAPPYQRISQLEYNGVPITADQPFILATNQFRATGGGGYPSTPLSERVCRIEAPLQDAMIDVLNRSEPAPWEITPPWRFAPLGGIEATILTHPEALASISDIKHLQPKLLSTTPEGFIRLSITL